MKTGYSKSQDKTPARQRLSKGLILAAVLLLLVSFGGAYTFAGRSTASGSSAVCPVSACISLDGQVDEPQTITLETGSYVQFNATDDKVHNIFLAHSAAQHDDPSRFESGDFNKGEAWKVQLKKDGSYTFADKYHQSVQVTIVAYTPGKEYKIQ